MSTSKKELKKQVKDLNEVLLKYIESSPNVAERAIKLAKLEWHIKYNLEVRESVREIKKRKLVDILIKKFDSLDIQEALEIDEKEAENKLKNSSFTIKEKNMILNKFSGNAKRFLEKYDKKSVN